MVHIQDFTNASNLEPHWGYVGRILPCKNDIGSCEYLDGVYWMHDVSMLYTFILWAVIGFLLLAAIAIRILKPVQPWSSSAIVNRNEREIGSFYYRSWRSIQAILKRRLLPESFGSITRLQMTVLVILLSYLLIFSLVGIVYKTWITPVKNSPGLNNIRTGLGGFADRIGALAYALTPLTVALSTRESFLTLMTGIPYQSFNFLHRWLGRVIFVQSFLHTLGWTLIEGRFYQPQPSLFREFIHETYIVWGCIAMLFITFLYIFSLRRVIHWTGHEFFRKSHYVVAGLYIGACWAHWSHLACWMIASLGLFGVDRCMRLLRTFLIHVGYIDVSKGFGFRPANSSVRYFPDDDGGVVRLDFDHNHEAWAVGQHFFLCFPALSVWQSHPLTVASVPSSHPSNPHHTYVVRCRNGETGRLKNIVLAEQANSTPKELDFKTAVITPVVLCGPYGTPLLPSIFNSGPEPTNILAIAGGTGVSLTLPVVLAASQSTAFSGAAIDFIWIIRRVSNIEWIASEVETLKYLSRNIGVHLRIHIYVTRASDVVSETTTIMNKEKDSASDNVEPILSEISARSEDDGKYNVTHLNCQHPSLQNIVSEFMETQASAEFRTRVIASGPAEIGHHLRTIVAGYNDGPKVMKGDKRWDVDLHWDDRTG